MKQRATRVTPKGSPCLLPDGLIVPCISQEKPHAVSPRYPESPAVPFIRRAIEAEEVLHPLAVGEFFFPVGTIKIDEKEVVS